MRLGTIFLITYILNTCCWAQVNPYIIDKVPVDITAKDSTVAQNQALLTGQRKALEDVLESLSEPIDKVQRLSETQLSDLLVGYEVYDERISVNRYRALITYHFDENAIQQWLKKSSTQSKTPLITAKKPLVASTHDPFDEVVATIHVPLDSSTRAIKDVTGSPVQIHFNTLEQWTTVLKNLQNATGVQRVIIEQFSPKIGVVTITLSSPEINLTDTLNQLIVLIENRHEHWQAKLQTSATKGSILSIQ